MPHFGKIKRSALLREVCKDNSYFSKVAELNSEGDLSGEDTTDDEDNNENSGDEGTFQADDENAIWSEVSAIMDGENCTK